MICAEVQEPTMLRNAQQAVAEGDWICAASELVWQRGASVRNGGSEMDEGQLEELRQKKLQEIQQAQAMDTQKKLLLKNLVEPKAYERLMNVRLANPELYDQLISLLAYLFKSGQVKGKIGEAQVLQLLSKLSGGRREPTITVSRRK